MFRAQHVVKIADYEKFQSEHPAFEHYLPDIRRFIAAPLKISDKIIGHIQIVNPKENLFQASGYLMMTLSRFIAIMIRNRDAARELERMSLYDQMTGLLNRRGLSNYFNNLPKGISCAFVFGDVNGPQAHERCAWPRGGRCAHQDRGPHHAEGTAGRG